MGTKKGGLQRKGFTPSTGDEPYLTGSKFDSGQYGEQTALSLGKLAEYAIGINRKIEEVQKTAAKGQLAIGKMLLQARELFPGDKEFGNWRSEQTEIKSMQVASNLMAVARKFSSAPKMIEACSYSALVELVSAPPALIKEIEAKVEAGIPAPTVKAIRDAKPTVPTSVGKTSKATTSFMKKEPEERDPEEEAIDLLQEPLLKRLNHKNPYVKLGLYPFGGPPHPYILDAIELWIAKQELAEKIDQDQVEKLYSAIHAIGKEYGH